MRTILAPVDFSDVTVDIMAIAEKLAGAFGGRVILAHVTEPEPQLVGYDPSALNIPVSVPPDPSGAHEKLVTLRAKYGGAETNILEVEGIAAPEILKMAKEHSVDLIIMGSHGHGALYRLIVGSVANAVLNDAECPVVIVPGSRPKAVKS